MSDYATSGAFRMAIVGGPGVGVPWGLCALVVEGLIEDHPELRPVGGQVLLPEGGQFDHWWCEAPDGTVIDPMTDVTYPDARHHEDPEADFLHGVFRCRLLRDDPTYDRMSAEPCHCDSCLGAALPQEQTGENE